MDNSSDLDALRYAYRDFVACILSLTDTQLLASMDGWAPRDVVAHLIGWNRTLLQASRSILVGQTPAYYSDAPNDYRTINAGLVERYPSRSKDELLGELDGSMKDLDAYLVDLPASELSSDHRVTHYTGQPATVGKVIRSLASEYENHKRQTTDWLMAR
jgi:hypothetical protein